MVCSRKRKFEEDERQSIPNVLQGEVARLDPKFLVNLDPSHCSNNGAVHLICKLGECPGEWVWWFAIHVRPVSRAFKLHTCSHGLPHCSSSLTSHSLSQLPRSPST